MSSSHDQFPSVEPPWIDFDFEFLAEEPNSIQRAAAFYEYARECKELLCYVEHLRRSEVLAAITAESEILNKAPELLWYYLVPYPLLWFAQSRAFPRQSFRDAIQTDTGVLFSMLGERNPVSDFPCSVLLGFQEAARKSYARRGIEEMYTPECALPDGEGASEVMARLITLDWRYTDEELKTGFGEVVKKLRPKEWPAPPSRGRRGQRTSAGAMDILHQLSALRCHRQGVQYVDAKSRGLDVYSSEKGWKKAIREAQRHIESSSFLCGFRGVPEVPKELKGP